MTEPRGQHVADDAADVVGGERRELLGDLAGDGSVELAVVGVTVDFDDGVAVGLQDEPVAVVGQVGCGKNDHVVPQCNIVCTRGVGSVFPDARRRFVYLRLVS